MYPREYFDTYWRPELKNDVFVAMPFHDEFLRTWSDAIKPAIEEDCAYGLRANRVDTTLFSGSIMMEIMEGIAHSRIILADISICQAGKWKGQRNGNVLYEVGLAHAVRQSSEVVLVRSDNESINFDLSGITVHSYPIDSLSEARKIFSSLVTEAIKQINQIKSLKVQKAIEALDEDCLQYLRDFPFDPFVGPRPKTMGEELVAVSKKMALAQLQRLGILSCEMHHELGSVYYWTNFGKAVLMSLGIKSKPHAL